jgi:hypothetical protein
LNVYAGTAGVAVLAAVAFCLNLEMSKARPRGFFAAAGAAAGSGASAGGAWGACVDQNVRCDEPACEAQFPDNCPNTPVCPDGAFRPCVDGCFEGQQICDLGAWGACSNEHVRCGLPACAAEHPVECP